MELVATVKTTKLAKGSKITRNLTYTHRPELQTFKFGHCELDVQAEHSHPPGVRAQYPDRHCEDLKHTPPFLMLLAPQTLLVWYWMQAPEEQSESTVHNEPSGKLVCAWLEQTLFRQLNDWHRMLKLQDAPA